MEKEIKAWELLDSRYLIREPWLTARKDCFRLPDGVVMEDYYTLEYPDWVNVIAITEDHLFIIEQQYRPGAGKVSHEICAGVCEEGESPLEAARRELLEETGYSGGEWTYYMSLSANAGTMNNLSHTYIARGVKRTAEPALEPTEDIKVELLTLEELKSLLTSGRVIQALMTAPLWRFLYENKL